MYYFIVNPGSCTGKGDSLWAKLEERLVRSGVEYEAFFTKQKGDATLFAEQICTEHPEMKRIIIVGGDGTSNEVINGLSDYNKFILGCIPTGSGNDLVRGLGIERDTEKALENVLYPHMFKRVDHCLLESSDGKIKRKFGVSSGIGYDADICYRALNSKLKKFLNCFGMGKLVYYMIGLRLIFSNKCAKATVILDGRRTIKYDRLIFAANMNTVYEGGGMPMGPAANPADGKITVTIVHDISRLRHLRLMPTILNGKHVNYRGVEQITAKTVEIITDRPLVLHTDGEYVGESSHVKYSCIPDKVRMIIR